MTRLPQTLCGLALMALAVASPASAQSPSNIGVRGFGTFGNITFTAKESFEAILDRAGGPIFGGGAHVLLPLDIYVELSASRFRQSGERVFIGPGDQIFKLGERVDVTITPLALTGGYRFTKLSRRLVPYGGIGYSSFRYQETAAFAEPSENVDQSFAGVHVVGGVEFLVYRWIAVGGEAVWSSIANALGKAGVSKHYGEDNLGGTSVRLKISVGR